jgi:AraC-like DNA-binding protein
MELRGELAVGAGAHPGGRRRVPMTLKAEGTPSLHSVELGRCVITSLELPAFAAYLPKTPPARENDAFSILLHTAGRVRFENEDHTGFSTPGHIVIYDENKDTAIESDETSERLVVTVPKSALPEPVIGRLTGTTFCEAGAPGLSAVFGNFVKETVSQSRRDIPRVHRLKLETLLLRFVSDLIEVSADEPTPSPSLLDVIWAEAVYTMETDLNARISASDLANKLHCSVRYIYRAFQTHGTTPAGHLLAMRLQYARDAIIANDDVLICEIAYASGFQSYSHFSRTFTRQFGMTPETARATSRNPGLG